MLSVVSIFRIVRLEYDHCPGDVRRLRLTIAADRLAGVLRIVYAEAIPAGVEVREALKLDRLYPGEVDRGNFARGSWHGFLTPFCVLFSRPVPLQGRFLVAVSLLRLRAAHRL